MDVETLARLQFALTIMFHYIFPPLSIGLSLAMVIIEGRWLWTKDARYLLMAKFWTKVFALTFAIGVATGIVMEFEFGTNWATYSRYVGDVFGSALAAEGVFAFFLESGFLAILLFGWNRVSPKLHFLSALMVSLGAHFSAIWIVVANSWMQTPAGFHIVGEGLFARAEIVDFWAMVLNPSSVTRLLHVIFGAHLAGAFLIISISCYYLLRKKHLFFAKTSLKVALFIAFFGTFAQAVTGHISGEIVAKYQPAKLAAFEGLYHTQKRAPLTLFGIVNDKEERVDFAVQIPGMLSFLAHGDMEKEVMGLDQVAKQDRPKVVAVFNLYRIMIVTWVGMVFLVIAASFFLWKNSLEKARKLLWFGVFSAILPHLANQAGWVAAEMGRYPWIVYNLLRISDGLSKSVTANQVLGSIIMFGAVYTSLFVLFIYLLDQKIKEGPQDLDEGGLYHTLKSWVK